MKNLREEIHQPERQTLVDLQLGSAIDNCLMRGGIFSYKLLLANLSSVRRFRGIGKRRWNRIVVTLRAMGYEIEE